MRTAIQLSEVGNAAIIVDPSGMQIIGMATDQTHQHDTSLEKSKCPRVKEDTCSLLDATEEKYDNWLLSIPGVCNGLNMQVSCINPWGWVQQRPNEQKALPSEGSFSWHPLRHAAIVAIENAAARDSMLFPPTSTSLITKQSLNGDMENCPGNEPAKRLKMDTKDVEQCAHEAYCGALSETNRPYLCTGLDIYLVWEPCTTCAMALVHQRFKRIFYAFPNPITGALGSVYRLHGEKSLNHQYSVFRVKVPEAYLNGSSDCSEKC